MDSSSARQPPQLPLASLPKNGKIKIGLCQMAGGSLNKAANIMKARQVIQETAERGAELIVLPEMWNCPYANESFRIFAEVIGGTEEESPSTTMLSEVARETGTTIVGGSIPECSDGRLYNTCCVYGSNGQLLGKHRKTHLFDIDIPGRITFKESLTLSPGESITVVDTEVGRLGIGICYDIRFPELAMLYASRGVHMICYPGAFNTTTGPVHWELLIKARAVDNQVFVAACSPARDTTAPYVAYGHSTVVGPFGEILTTIDEQEGVILAELDLGQIDVRRTNMPLQQQRRGDLYQVTDVTRFPL